MYTFMFAEDFSLESLEFKLLMELYLIIFQLHFL